MADTPDMTVCAGGPLGLEDEVPPPSTGDVPVLVAVVGMPELVVEKAPATEAWGGVGMVEGGGVGLGTNGVAGALLGCEGGACVLAAAPLGRCDFPCPLLWLL